MDALTNNFDSSLQKVDFANNPEPSRKIINDWVEDKTNDKIKVNDQIPTNTKFSRAFNFRANSRGGSSRGSGTSLAALNDHNLLHYGPISKI